MRCLNVCVNKGVGQQSSKSKNKPFESIDTPAASILESPEMETVNSPAVPQAADPESVENNSDAVNSQVSKIILPKLIALFTQVFFGTKLKV